METFFQSDSRIKSWLEQIVEKIFTVCLLKGTESELAIEFAKGRQLVVKIAMLLTDISSLPPTAVVDAIHQLLKERLPDQRVIDNFPNFYQVMEDMMREGIAVVSENRNPLFEQNIKRLDSKDNQEQHMPQKPTSVIILAGGREPMLTPRSSGSYMTLHCNQENPTSTIQNLTINKSENPKPDETTSQLIQQKLNIGSLVTKPSSEGFRQSRLSQKDHFAAKEESTPTEAEHETLLPLIEVGVSEVDETNVVAIKLDINHPIFSETLNMIYQEIPTHVQTSTDRDLRLSEYLDIPVLAAVANQITMLDQSKTMPIDEDSTTETIPSPKVKEIKVTNYKPSDIELQQNLTKDLPLSKNRVRSSSQVPAEATRLALVLHQVFPNTQARWNFNLGENNFLVQINDLLIYLETLSEGNRVEKEMKKEGWKIIICNNEDLYFPRRLERAIHRVLKDSKYKL